MWRDVPKPSLPSLLSCLCSRSTGGFTFKFNYISHNPLWTLIFCWKCVTALYKLQQNWRLTLNTKQVAKVIRKRSDYENWQNTCPTTSGKRKASMWFSLIFKLKIIIVKQLALRFKAHPLDFSAWQYFKMDKAVNTCQYCPVLQISMRLCHFLPSEGRLQSLCGSLCSCIHILHIQATLTICRRYVLISPTNGEIHK